MQRYCICYVYHSHHFFLLFFFNDPATTEIYTLSLHDALPISVPTMTLTDVTSPMTTTSAILAERWETKDRKSTRLNSSHVKISYAVFCLKKKKQLLPHLIDVVTLTHHSDSETAYDPLIPLDLQ